MKIAISGKQGSGKTTLANEFLNKYFFTKCSFANKVKEIAVDLFNLSVDEAYGENKDRVMLQQIGKNMRDIDNDVWINYLIRRIKNIEQDANRKHQHIIIDDVRYKNEFDALKKAGFIMIRIECPEEERKRRLGDCFNNPEHQSETDLDGVKHPIVKQEESDRAWDVVIVNNENISINRFKGASDKIFKIYSKND